MEKASLRLTKLETKTLGLFDLLLQLCKDGKEIDRLIVCSGQPKAQKFRMAYESKAGSLEPLPEGYYTLGKEQWAGGKDIFSAEFNQGLGPCVLDLHPLMETERSELLVHIDWNRDKAPGTAGCVGIIGIDNFKKFLTWVRKYDCSDFVVNWGLGSVESIPEKKRIKEDGAPKQPEKLKPLEGFSVGIDVGHGLGTEGGTYYEWGAEGNGRREYDLNKIEAHAIKDLLEARGAKVDVYDYGDKGAEALSLGYKGYKAKGHDVFISVHHNAFDRHENYTCTMVNQSKAFDGDFKLAKLISKKVSGYLGFSDAGTLKVGLGIYYLRPELKSVKGFVLTESFFVDSSQLKGKNLDDLCKKAAHGTAEAIEEFLLS